MYKPALSLMLLLIPAVVTSALEVEIRTNNRTGITGAVTDIDKGFLYLATDNYQKVGIPLDTILNLRPARDTDPDHAAGAALQLREILHLWDADIQLMLVGFTQSLAEKHEWNTCHQAASTIETCSRDPKIRRMASELKAHALFKMGLFKQCRDSLEHTGSTDNPLQASVRVCWMMAHLAEREGDLEKAVFWALIPSLRIPSDDSLLADQLQKDGRKWLDSK